MQLFQCVSTGLTLGLFFASLASAATPAAKVTQTPAEATIHSEDTIEGLRVPLAALSKSVANLQLPDESGRDVFAEHVQVVDLGPAASDSREELLDLGFERGQWLPAGASEIFANGEISLWEDFLATVDFFHHFNFYNIRGGFEADNVYHTDTGFKGLAQLKSGMVQAFSGKLSLDWTGTSELVGDEDSTVWRIARFATKNLEFAEGPEPLFAEVSDIAFDPEDLHHAVHSPRDENMITAVLDVRSGRVALEDARGGGPGPASTMVVDIDNDGLDDIYLVGTAMPSMLFRNKGDGTFEEVAARHGLNMLDVKGGAFGDLDNDGDPDLIAKVGPNRGARYFLNDNGYFVYRTGAIDTRPPNLVGPISISDFNNDGLLDVYLGRSGGMGRAMVENERREREGLPYEDKLSFVDDEEAHEMLSRARKDGHPLSNRYAAQDWLLVNTGAGRLKRVDVGTEWGLHRAFATAFSDIDLDGDMDLYVVNEIGPNNLVQNNGDGTFTEISNEVTGEIGWGMGAGVGDYDNDGRPDFYTTNMFSKAGLRVAALMGSSDVITQSARGNTLMRNTVNGFIKVSSQDESGIQVEAADFGWGSDFVDLNNDGNLDIYAPAGALSMPPAVATIGDS